LAVQGFEIFWAIFHRGRAMPAHVAPS